MDNNVLNDITPLLKAKDFYNQQHQEIYQVIVDLYNDSKPIDIITVSDVLKIKNMLENIGGMDYLVYLITSTPHSANAMIYAKIVAEKSGRRKIIKTTTNIIQQAYEADCSDIIELKSNVLQQISDIEISGAKTKSGIITNIVKEVRASIEEDRKKGDDNKLLTGFHDIDKVTAGLHNGELTIIAARPGVGKTSVALHIMLNLAKKNNYCLFISREMSNHQIVKRIIANVSNINGHKLRLCNTLTDEDLKNIDTAVGQIQCLPIEINDQLENVQEIRAYCRELKNKNKLDILIIDYIGLLMSLKKTDNRRLEIEDISRQLKKMTLEFNIPIIVLSQLNRDSDRDNRKPRLIDLRESGSIEQDADQVLFLHVPEGTDLTQDRFNIEIIIAKQRNGETGSVFLSYERKTFRLFNINNTKRDSQRETHPMLQK